MFKQTLVSVSVMSAMLALTACSSTGSNNHLDKYFKTPLVSKPVDASGLKAKAQENAALLVRNELGSKDFDIKNYEITIKDKTYKEGDKVDLKDLGGSAIPALEVTNIKEKFDAQVKDKKLSIESDRKAYLYQQKYSIVGSLSPITHKVNGETIKDVTCAVNCDEAVLRGERTQVLPSSKASYVGVAWAKNKNNSPDYTMGSLSYEVDFDKKEGSGKIDGADGLSNITLENAKIDVLMSKDSLDNQVTKGQGIVGNAMQNGSKGTYNLGFFGGKAQEIAGYVDFENKKDTVDVGFSGVKK